MDAKLLLSGLFPWNWRAPRCTTNSNFERRGQAHHLSHISRLRDAVKKSCWIGRKRSHKSVSMSAFTMCVERPSCSFRPASEQMLTCGPMKTHRQWSQPSKPPSLSVFVSHISLHNSYVASPTNGSTQYHRRTNVKALQAFGGDQKRLRLPTGSYFLIWNDSTQIQTSIIWVYTLCHHRDGNNSFCHMTIKVILGVVLYTHYLLLFIHHRFGVTVG